MSTATTSLDLGGEGNSFPFNAHGDSVTGKVVTMEPQQQTDMDSGAPATWDNGQPKLMYRVELATDLKNDESDDGHRSVYLKGSRKPESMSSLAAVLAAVRKASGSTQLVAGGVLTLTYVGDGEASKRGRTAPKQYAATYSPPRIELAKPAEDESPGF